MAELTTGLYSGKGLAVNLPTDNGRATERLSDFIVRAEELKYKAFKENEQEFLKNSQIDPAFFISKANQDTQAKMLDDYNRKWAGVMKETNNNMSTDQKQQMLAEKNFIISQQQGMQSDYEQAMAERAMIEKDMGVNYDQTEWFSKKWIPYMQSGQFDKTPMQLKAKSIESVYGTRKISGASAYEEPDKDNPTRIRVTSASKKEVAPQIVDVIFTNEAVKRHAIEEWTSRTPEDKEAYFNDLNGDSIISDEERRQGDVLTKSLDNPIIKAYVDNHWGNLVDVNFVNKQRPPATTKTTGGNFVVFDIGMGTPVKYQPTERQTFKNYTTYHAVPEWTTQNIPADNITVQKPTGEKVKVVGKTLSLQLTGYDENTDEFTFITKGNYYGNNTQGAGDQIAISRADLPPKFNDFVILVNGKQVKVGEVQKGATPAKVNIGL